MEQVFIDIIREAVIVIIKVSLPTLLSALVVGLVVSIFQTATSIQEQTLAFIPKIIAVLLSLVIFGSWMLSTLLSMMNSIFSHISNLI